MTASSSGTHRVHASPGTVVVATPAPPRGERARELAAVRSTAARLPYVVIAGRRKREVALTFDDGPGPSTLGLLRTLERLRVPATFFQLGGSVRQYPAAQRALLRYGRAVLADHTATHPRLTSLTEALPRIVRTLRKRHYHLVTVPKLLLDNPPSRDQPPGP